MLIEITDDSGFLAVIDPDAYASFVAEDWELEDLVSHFRTEMSRHRLLIWGTGSEGLWGIDVRSQPSNVNGYRELRGGILCTSGRLLLTNYESLTMAAQFEDVDLPQNHESEQILKLNPGSYLSRIVQSHDPEDESEQTGPGFVLELVRTEGLPAPWNEIPWSEYL